MKKKRSKKGSLRKKHRFMFILSVICVVFFVLIGRLFYLMIDISPKFKALAAEQQKSEIKISPKRGKILDRNGNELALSGNLYQVNLDLKTIRQDVSKGKINVDKLINNLASILNMKPESVTKIFNTKLNNGLPASYAVLKRQVDKTAIDKIKALKVMGIVISPDTKRYYTDKDFLSSVLGNVNIDGVGVSGVELEYNKELTGKPGTYAYEKDLKNNALPNESQYVEPVNGKDVVLTIDEVIQKYAEDAAQKALIDNKAKAVNIVIMNPKNGDILAMANKSSTMTAIEKLWKNPSVQDTFEPGSIFKVITAACALENNIGINDAYIDNGVISVDKVPIHCWYLPGHGKESFGDILRNSCNVGFVELGMKIGKDKLVSFAQKMGFGQSTGIDLPGEGKGILRTPAKMTNVDLASVAFGQSLSVTQVQYMAAFNAIANGGKWIKPHVVKGIAHTDENDKVVIDKPFSDLDEKVVFDSNLAAILRQDLLKVVTDGVGANAFVKGLDVAGKTGTAQKADPATGRYVTGKYMSSFAGMAPAADPKITLLISIDEPMGASYYAGDVSAPVAKVLFQEIFNYMSLNNGQDVLGDK